MPIVNGTLLEIRFTESGLAGLVDCPRAVRPGPGQYLIASSQREEEALPVTLFSMSLPDEPLQVSPPLPAGWYPGLTLRLRGPLGHGFTLPREARRVALVAYQSPAGLLLSLTRFALKQGAAVTLCSTFPPPPALPEEVEVLPFSQLKEAVAWADYLAAAFAREHYAELRQLLGNHLQERASLSAEGLILTPMPCAGLGSCGVCAVHTRAGWKHICLDGPVFSLRSLEEAP
ncbi:MAG TPA: hypothetical protein DEQ80_04065 [Anaerolinea thermolimosa]|uniref:Dihydroorotate dehydrogenase electron transfer subunit iron-sulphur cluster binding domain-containing protein n=1 Tax=Anaerolinea thermolimosa TaxID=229919 RepID=A0A3D1JFL5_9CHLR|nr:hypothetical protein [Anaerolinea thermolimosa]GAP05557.1 protein containing iron-sulfur cluster binding domain of dihydroorotate dehydrogenase B [Anaerolinea thermolimosa]HCE17015.1 hypothetical protein [Anaerolinea thermolimosa]